MQPGATERAGTRYHRAGSVICGRQYRLRMDVRVRHDGRLNELSMDKLEPEKAFPMDEQHRAGRGSLEDIALESIGR